MRQSLHLLVSQIAADLSALASLLSAVAAQIVGSRQTPAAVRVLERNSPLDHFEISHRRQG